ncbi:MAG: hypothetical protein IJK66_00055 [Bacilli bacterium]|jgi:uncharacterized protein YpuA (DUF1002 family)|nr:hypothetical protein [Bacilli bacterium]
MDSEKVFRTVMIFLFVIFLTIYFSNSIGYYEYGMHKKIELTNEEIKRFEDDVKNNKEIDVEDYQKNTIKDYSNEISKISLSISNFASKYIKKGINGVFKAIDKMMT